MVISRSLPLLKRTLSAASFRSSTWITLPGFTHNVDVAGDFAYVAAGVAGLQVVGVSNRATPFVAGAADTAGNAQDVPFGFHTIGQ